MAPLCEETMITVLMLPQLWEQVLFDLQKIEEPSVGTQTLIDELTDAIVDNETQDASK